MRRTGADSGLQLHDEQPELLNPYRIQRRGAKQSLDVPEASVNRAARGRVVVTRRQPVVLDVLGQGDPAEARIEELALLRLILRLGLPPVRIRLRVERPGAHARNGR